MSGRGKKDASKKEAITVSHVREITSNTSSSDSMQLKVQNNEIRPCDEEMTSISYNEGTLLNTSQTLNPPPPPVKLKSGKAQKRSKKVFSNKGTLSADQEVDSSLPTCTSSTDNMSENDSTPKKRNKGDQVQETN